MLGVLFIGTPAKANPYTWNVAAGNWSTTANWSPAAATGGPGSSDTASITNATSSYTVTYDASASGSIGTLNLTQSTGNFLTSLSLNKQLSIVTSGTIYNLAAPGSTTQEIINLNNNNLVINSGATLTLGLYTGSGSAALNNKTNISANGGTGVVMVNGTLTDLNGSPTINAPVTLSSSGKLVIDSESGTGGVSSTLTILGNYSSTGGTINFTSSGSAAGNGKVIFQGSTISIDSTSSVTGITPSVSNFTFANATGTQTITLGIPFQFDLRNTGSSGVAVSKDFTSNATGNAVDEMQFETSGNIVNLVLENNLNLASGQTTPFKFVFDSTTLAAAENIDLNGFTYDTTTGTTTAFNPSGSGIKAGLTQINIKNSGTSSLSGGNGIFRAGSFTLSSADVGIGSGVFLQATNTAVANDLGIQSSGVTTINPTSTFYYSGVGTASLTSNRAIGRLLVGNGTAVSSLNLASAALSVGADVTVSASSVLDLQGNNLTESSASGATAGGLNGAGTVRSTTGTPTVTLDTTGGNGSFSGTISNGIAVAKVGTGTQTFSTANTYSGGTTVSAGTLFVNGGVSGSSSGTGSGAVTVGTGTASSGTLAGSGNITAGATASTGVKINGGGTLASGNPATQVTNAGTATAAISPTGGMTLTNTLLTVSGTGAGSLSANLTFDLAAGNNGLGGTPGRYNFTNPNIDSTYLTLAGTSTVNFTGTDSISLVDLTSPGGNSVGTLSLRQSVPYLLIDGDSATDISGLVIAVGAGTNTKYYLSQTGASGYVVGVATSSFVSGASSITSSDYTAIAINQFGSDGVTPLNANGPIYADSVLYLNAGDLEVVPEPGTWALMVGGLALLVVIQRRKRNI